jgi:hypothetical protein
LRPTRSRHVFRTTENLISPTQLITPVAPDRSYGRACGAGQRAIRKALDSANLKRPKTVRWGTSPVHGAAQLSSELTQSVKL